MHLSGEGIIEEVYPAGFMDRLDGLSTSISIYASCKNGSPVGSESAAKNSVDMIGKKREYNLIFDNCHQFTAGCLTGRFNNASNYMWILKDDSKNIIPAEEWRV